MTITWGDTGRATMGELKTLNITPYVLENSVTSTALTVGSSSTLPTGMTPTVSYTVNTSVMVPSFSGINVLNYTPVYGFNASGQNTSGASQTVYYQINKNGSIYKSGNISVTNNNYWTISMEQASLVNGDKIDFYAWTPASSGVNYIYNNCFCIPSRVDTGAKNICQVSMNVVTLASSTYFPVAGTNVSSGWGGSVQLYASDETSTTNAGMIVGLNKTTNIPLMTVGSTFKLFFLQAEGNTTSIYNNAKYPNMVQSSLPKTITYRDLFF